MRVAIEDYELYNNGFLLLKWFTLEDTAITEIEQYVLEQKRIIAESENLFLSDEVELFIADYEDSIIELSEHDLFKAKAIADTHIENKEDIKFLLQQGLSFDEAIETEVTRIPVDDFIDENIENMDRDTLLRYFNTDAYKRDLEIEHTIDNNDVVFF